MKAMTRDRYGSADVLAFTEVAMPVVGDNEVLLRVRAAGIGPNVWHALTGLPYLARMGFGLRVPKSPLLRGDVAGTVTAVGGGVRQFRPGDEVFGVCDGAFAEYACARPDELAIKPSNLTFEEAAAVPISACAALRGLRHEGQLRSGQRVLIIGASGGVGSFAVQLAKAFGAEVTGVCSTAKVGMVRSLGADHVIDYTRGDFAGGGRYDLVLDTAGRRSLSQLRKALTPKGTLVIVGGEGGGRWTGGFQRQVLGAAVVSRFVRQRLCSLISREPREDLEVLKGLIEGGKVKPFISKTYPLHQAPSALRDADEGHGLGKVVVTLASLSGEQDPTKQAVASDVG
ncbi:MAG: NAD(P)-dependent alcohol dehydrogenase [Acidimicrobiales bacterium]